MTWDVTQAINGEGVVSFALRRSSPEGNPFNSREAASNQPQLIVESFPINPPPPPPPPPPDSPPTVSADALPTWQINGVVWSQVVVNNIVYATGSFTKRVRQGRGWRTGEVDAQNIFAYDITTGAAGPYIQSFTECTGTCDCCFSGRLPRLVR